ncbi:Reticulon-4-interacting protein 1 [Cladobotryum mycophilum]|uniref:Reticulon-4-interacting protein 1 n=1 Tax=Cladobotryum mycophilum TaxID=491253 RepID=A0ABR0SR95_9HYPO
MLSLYVPSYSTPAGYQLGELPRPIPTHPKDVLIKVHATSINPIDVKKAAGKAKLALKDEFPYKIGYDCAGVVAGIGSQVSSFKIGDEVFVRLPECHRGAWSEFAITTENFIALKPAGCSMADAASIPLAAMTALQALRHSQCDIEGKTVFVPAGLSGTGLFACQLAKNVFHAAKVITTVSTAKVSKVHELLGDGVVDEIIDYQKSDPKSLIPQGSVDCLIDTIGASMEYLSLMKPKTGIIVTISIMTSGETLQNSSMMRLSPGGQEKAHVPILIRFILNFQDYIRRARASYYGVTYSAFFLNQMGKTWI